ncbi:phage tail protein [Nocardioides gilvus]|uniref:phage tail protein n=1 Tax=Nocardioides gilvus TaxID=1735589 RepID=UPI000D7464D8|nr:phage tail protein [Nocardioides gilvus]
MGIFTAFNFSVLITLEGESAPLCEGGFSACDGLEVTLANKTIRAGGDNGRMIHLGGIVNNGTLTLKRGMTSSFDLWDWFERVTLDEERGLRATCQVVSLAADRRSEQATFVLERCLPTKLKVPALDAATGQLAVEELQVAYETIRLRKPQEASRD